MNRSTPDAERISDVIDFAAELEERERQHAQTVRKPVEPRTGKCKACEEPLRLPQALFCDDFCRDLHDRQRRLKMISGRA